MFGVCHVMYACASVAGCCFVTFFTRKAALKAQDALHNIKTLSGVSAFHVVFFPMGYLKKCGKYLAAVTGFDFHHGLCPCESYHTFKEQIDCRNNYRKYINLLQLDRGVKLQNYIPC